MGWLRHAFALRPEGAEALSPAEEELVERFCRAVVRRRLTAAVLAALEMARPLSGVAAQGIHFFTPLLSLLLPPERISRLAELLQRPDALQILCQRLESMEANGPEVNSQTGSSAPEASDASGCAATAGQAAPTATAACPQERIPQEGSQIALHNADRYSRQPPEGSARPNG
jgi:hypothetical protein